MTGYLDAAARNLGMASQPDHDERYTMAEEFMEVVYKLWQSSWREDAVVLDRATGVYTEPSRVREINHEGKYFNVPGPHFCQPSPQRVPVIMQAGTSKAGTAFSSKHAEMVFVSGHNPASCASFVKTIREGAKKAGRDPQSIKVLSKICIVLGRTQEEAEAKFEEYASYGDTEGALALFGGWTGYDMAKYRDDEELRVVETNAIRSYMEALGKHKPKVGKWTKKVLAESVTIGGLGGTIVGSPENVADELERWIEESDLDGFNIVSFPYVSFFTTSWWCPAALLLDLLELHTLTFHSTGIRHPAAILRRHFRALDPRAPQTGHLPRGSAGRHAPRIHLWQGGPEPPRSRPPGVQLSLESAKVAGEQLEALFVRCVPCQYGEELETVF